jgi:hypothetical protein
MQRLAFVAFSMVVVAGCNERNPEFCPNGATANGAACIDAPAGTGGHCTPTTGCTADPMFPICDTTKGGGTCVTCTTDKHDLCMGATPRCDMATESCVACVDDSDCGSTGVCLPTGACADPRKTIHAVSTSGSSNASTCGGNASAGSACDLDTALMIAKMGLGKNVIKLDDAGPYKSMTNFTVDVDAAVELIVDARGATLQAHSSSSPVITINDNKGMTMLGGIVSGATGGGGDGIRCGMNATLTIVGATLQMNDESGIDASSCTATVTNSIIRDNGKAGGFAGIEFTKGLLIISQSQLISNGGGGINISNATFAIVGNVFLSNGSITAPAGGLVVSTNTVQNRLEFNSFTDNKSGGGVAPGIQCTPTSALTAQNNIIYSNSGSIVPQVGGGCMHAYSDIGPLPVPTAPTNLDGGNNMSMDPNFMSPTSDLRLQAVTPVRGKANPQADLGTIAAKDLAGKPRVPPADLGAYQAPPM